MSHTKTWSFGALLTTIALLASLLAVALAPSARADNDENEWPPGCVAAQSSTPGADGFTAPAPCFMDASGTDQDQYYIPVLFFEHPDYDLGGYRVDGKPQDQGLHDLKPGVTSVTVTASYESGSWTFVFTDDEFGAEAKNRYWVEVDDKCKRGFGTRYREVTAFVENVLDEDLPEGTTGKAIHSIYPDAIARNGSAAYDTMSLQGVLDGEIGEMPILESATYVPGLRPGEHRIVFWQSDTGYASNRDGYVVKRMKLTVPRCGKRAESPSGHSARGNLKRSGCKAVRVKADATGFSAMPKAKYRLVKKLKGRKIKKRNFAVTAGELRRFVAKKPRHAKAVMVLRVKSREGRWVKLDRVRVPRCR